MLRVGQLELDLIERTARRGARRIELLPREFRLLEYTTRRGDQMLTRAMLLKGRLELQMRAENQSGRCPNGPPAA
jgi:DNA-binding response OmpR family regulator